MANSKIKKIGILSFPRYYNYGTYLQLYALNRTIEKLGYICEIIDYTPHIKVKKKKESIFSFFESMMKKISSIENINDLKRKVEDRIYNKKKRKLFEKRKKLYLQFLLEHFELSPRRYYEFKELDENPPNCDAFVVGSDQVWNPVGHYKDASYYLKFAPKGQRIAYAPSIGLAEIPDNTKEWMKKQILEIPFLSIRENDGAKAIKDLTGRTAQVVLDPTLLITKKEWNPITRLPKLPYNKYILCYFLESDDYIRLQTKIISKKLNLPIVVLPVNKRDILDKNKKINKIFNAGPSEFVGLFKNASFICTDSFHGTVFSIIYNRPFFTFKRYDNPAQAALHSRMDSILNLTGLKDRVITKGEKHNKKIIGLDFDFANQKILKEKEKSLLFLSESLEKALKS